ncbi:MAG: hypothetical protein D6683_13015, partial [Actinomyces sp.]
MIRRGTGLVLVVVLVGALAGAATALVEAAGPRAGRTVAVTGTVERGVGEWSVAEPAERTLEPYRGYGAWVDVFDYSPPYAGDPPPV